MTLPAPHGGSLKELLVDAETAADLKAEAVHLPDWTLTGKQTADLELLLNGAFSPLDGFLTERDYDAVCRDMRLADGTVWPMPVTLDVTEAFADGVRVGDRVALRHPEGLVLAIMTVESQWRPDPLEEATRVFGTTDDAHPAVFMLKHHTHPVYLGGRVEGLELPPHHTYAHLRHAPRALRDAFAERGWERVVGFQTRNPMHRAHVELTKRAAKDAGAHLLIHPVVGRTKPGDLDYFVRVRCYEAVLEHYPAASTQLAILPLAMRMGGPREALWHALIRKNHGCTHFIVGRDHAGPGKDANGNDFYGPYDAQELVQRYQDEIGIEMVPFRQVVYVEDRDQHLPVDEVPEGARTLHVSGTEFRRRLRAGLPIPAWFSYPDVVAELRKRYPPRDRQGFTILFTGLSGSGKSTLANVLVTKLMMEGSRPVTLLDGDLVRKHLSSELGFSKAHRDINIKRIGYVASEITKNGGIAVCAPIAPYARTRREVREMIEDVGGFVLVHVATPLEVCEERDRKGLYAKARAGLIRDFTGVSDPYEAPEDADVVVDTTDLAPGDAVDAILKHLHSEGYLAAPERARDAAHVRDA